MMVVVVAVLANKKYLRWLRVVPLSPTMAMMIIFLIQVLQCFWNSGVALVDVEPYKDAEEKQKPVEVCQDCKPGLV